MWCVPCRHLSLGVGVAVSRALGARRRGGNSLKWPNDIWFEDRKLGGVLIELRAEAGGPAHVVIGVGVNVSLPDGGSARNRDRWGGGGRGGGRLQACPFRAIWWPGPSWTNF